MHINTQSHGFYHPFRSLRIENLADVREPETPQPSDTNIDRLPRNTSFYKRGILPETAITFNEMKMAVHTTIRTKQGCSKFNTILKKKKETETYCPRLANLRKCEIANTLKPSSSGTLLGDIQKENSVSATIRFKNEVAEDQTEPS